MCTQLSAQYLWHYVSICGKYQYQNLHLKNQVLIMKCKNIKFYYLFIEKLN